MLGHGIAPDKFDKSKPKTPPGTASDVLDDAIVIERFKCGFCGRAFQSEKLFLSHLREHHLERKIKKQKLTGTIELKQQKVQSKASLPRLFIKSEPSINYLQLYEKVTKVIRDRVPAAITASKKIKEEQVELDIKPNIRVQSEILKPDDSAINSEVCSSAISIDKLSTTPVPMSSMKQIPEQNENFRPYEFRSPLTADLEPNFFDCPECCFRGQNSEALVNHMTALHSRKIEQLIKEKEKVYHDCSQCCFRAPDEEALQIHLKILHNKGSSDQSKIMGNRNRFLDCSYCCFRGQTEDALLRHIRVLHLNTVSRTRKRHYLDCSQCCFRAQDSAALSKHVRALHPRPKRRKTGKFCDLCGSSTGGSLHLASH